MRREQFHALHRLARMRVLQYDLCVDGIRFIKFGPVAYAKHYPRRSLFYALNALAKAREDVKKGRHRINNRLYSYSDVLDEYAKYTKGLIIFYKKNMEPLP